MTKLTPELQTNFLKLLELGVPIKYACEALNIDESTYFVWMKQGKEQSKGKYFEFFKSVQSIPGKAMARKLHHIEKAAEKGNVTAAIWFLKTKYPELFGDKLQIDATLQHQNPQFQPIQFVLADENGNSTGEVIATITGENLKPINKKDEEQDGQ